MRLYFLGKPYPVPLAFVPPATASGPRPAMAGATQKKIIVVFGATGAQGGSVAQALLDDDSFSVRAVTRNPAHPAAKALLSRGAEVVKGDLNNLDSLEQAMEGAYGAFVVTTFSVDFNKEQESLQSNNLATPMPSFGNSESHTLNLVILQGKNTAEVAKCQNLKHVVFSGLDHVEKLTGGQLKVPFFDSKGEAEARYRELGVPFTSVRLPCYYENFLNFYPPQRRPGEDAYTVALPMGDTPVHAMAVSDLGIMVLNIFKAPEVYIGKAIHLSVETLTVQGFADVLSQCLGKKIRDAKISTETFEQQTSKPVADMFRYLQIKTNFDEALTHQLNPRAKTFQQWVEEQKEKFQKLI
ncbi:nmrA-like family domain-containing protein 1 isoform X1 [Hemicordylus capensis]|uniref:nmrA-like family domain-containing protein 1 isoform X1 n=1 Tax=Hemicordylus capensis TaxID=884348 RepID=UPI002303194D|nr:nmrA-like family domain-containing protein 1 isoform X1 [Hemicordylus capensis]